MLPHSTVLLRATGLLALRVRALRPTAALWLTAQHLWQSVGSYAGRDIADQAGDRGGLARDLLRLHANRGLAQQIGGIATLFWQHEGNDITSGPGTSGAS